MHYRCEVYLRKLDGRPIIAQVSAMMDRGVKAVTGWDWFVVGGRWSGDKQLRALDKDKLEAFYAEFKRRGYGWFNAVHGPEERKRDSQALFMEFFPDFKGEPPIWRDQYKENGGAGDVCRASEVPDGLRCHTLVLPGSRGRCTVLTTERWNGKRFVKTGFNGNVLKELKKHGLLNGYLVTVDYHS